METTIDKELQTAINACGEIATKAFEPTSIKTEISDLELSYKDNPSANTKTKLLTRYVLISKSLPTSDSELVVKTREKFQIVFPDHFRAFMEMLRSGSLATLSKWSGCLLCKHYLAHGCAKGLVPRKMSSRYLNRDYACSGFEEK